MDELQLEIARAEALLNGHVGSSVSPAAVPADLLDDECGLC